MANKIDTVLKEIQKKYGQGSVMKLGEQVHQEIEVISSGSLSLDIALGVGGYPRGRIIEIYGPESSGKTTLTLHAIAQAQKQGLISAFVDAEHALDPSYAQNLGVDLNELIISQPDTGEQALDIVEDLVKSSEVGLIVVDSVAALVPRAEIEGDMGDNHIGLQARLMSQALRKLSGIVNKTNATVIFINQLREKVGIIFGSPEVTTGGKALKFYATIRIDVRKGEALKDGTEIIGNKTRVKVVKNKVAPPFKNIELELLYGKGISKIDEVINLGSEMDIIDKAGSWYSYDNDKIGQGKDAVKKYFEQYPEKYVEIEQKIREKISNKE